MSFGFGFNYGFGIAIQDARVDEARATIVTTDAISASARRLVLSGGAPVATSDLIAAAPTIYYPKTNLVLDLNADVGITGSAGTFAWADQSGGNNNATAGAGSLGLSTNAADSDFNAHNSVSLNGSNDFVDASAIANTFSGTTKAFYAVIVAKYTLGAGAGDVFAWSRAASNAPFMVYRLLQSGGNGQQQSLRRDDSAANNLTVTGVNTTTNTKHLDEWRYDATGKVNWTRDGSDSPAATAEVTTACTFDRFYIGAHKLGATATGFWQQMKVARVMVYSAVPSTTDQGALRGYLKTLYATP